MRIYTVREYVLDSELPQEEGLAEKICEAFETALEEWNCKADYDVDELAENLKRVVYPYISISLWDTGAGNPIDIEAAVFQQLQQALPEVFSNIWIREYTTTVLYDKDDYETQAEA